MLIPKSAITLIIDQLPAAMLGPYGNTIMETTHFNRLGSRSLLFDFSISDGQTIDDAYHGMWNRTDGGSSESVIRELRMKGIETILITDEKELVSRAKGDLTFDQVIYIEPPAADDANTELAGTQLAHFFAEVAAWLSTEFQPGQFCWIHSRGLAGAWDAPYEMRCQFAGEDDPPPPRFVEPPRSELVEAADPDQLLGWQQAAFAQVMLIDECLGVLLDEIESMEGSQPLLAMGSIRGCGLGEHGLVGVESHLYSELIHLPLFICFPESENRADFPVGRSGALIRNHRFVDLIVDWLNENPARLEATMELLDRVVPDRNREFVILRNPTFEMVQTHAWKLIRRIADRSIQLFAKPDDRWDINDVSDRCPMVVEKLSAFLDQQLLEDSTRQSLNGIALEDDLAIRRD